jgi:hypothetical protein
MTEKSSPGTWQTDGKNLVCFGEKERKLAKLSMPTFTYQSSSSLFYAQRPLTFASAVNPVTSRAAFPTLTGQK